jgi:hypothetical protein
VDPDKAEVLHGHLPCLVLLAEHVENRRAAVTVLGLQVVAQDLAIGGEFTDLVAVQMLLERIDRLRPIAADDDRRSVRDVQLLEDVERPASRRGSGKLTGKTVPAQYGAASRAVEIGRCGVGAGDRRGRRRAVLNQEVD